MIPEDGIFIKRSETSRIHVHLVNNNGERIAISYEKMIKDKWMLSKSLQLLPAEWKQIQEIELS